MEQADHLAILKQGVANWNRWREQRRESRLNLSGVNLVGIDLHGVQLDRVRLTRAKLRNANLNGADLSGAYLRGADLRDANLEGADLEDADLVAADLRRVRVRGAAISNANLEQANLSHTDLSERLLVGTKLSKARLTKTCLREASLNLADLHGTDLSGADLQGADLTGANLSQANLDGADLRNAILVDAHLIDADLTGSDFTEAICEGTTFAGLDLSLAIGLESIVHRGPSTLSVDTIYRSRAQIPTAFLRGVGVPGPLITFVHSLVQADEQLHFYSCFISYSDKDRQFCSRLHEDLQKNDIRCWFAPENLKIGEPFRRLIDEAIREHDKLLLVLSVNSIQSAWVETEVEAAFEKERRSGQLALFPIRLDDTVMKADEAWAATIRRTRHIGDFSEWNNEDVYQQALRRLLRDLQA